MSNEITYTIPTSSLPTYNKANYHNPTYNKQTYHKGHTTYNQIYQMSSYHH